LNRIWNRESGRILFAASAVALLTILFDNFFIWLSLALFIYVCWLLINLARLDEWVEKSLRTDPPDARGLWEDIVLTLYRYRNRNQKRQKKLVNRLTQFQEATQALPDVVIVLDSEWGVQWANKTAIRMLSIKAATDIGQRISNIVRNPVFVDYLEGEDFSEPVKIPAPVDNSLTLLVHIVPYGKKRYLLVARDITKLERLEKVRQDFVANVSHEMRTPLTVINGYLETLCDDDSIESATANLYEQMHQQSMRMQNIVNDLLLLAKLESADSQATRNEISLAGLLSILKEESEGLSRSKQLNIQFEADTSLKLRGSESELHSVFSNLLSNAIRYTPEHGLITVRWYCKDNKANFEVQDTGIGIATQHIDRLTERFYRVDVGRSRHSGGTGLGLAIVKHVLLRHRAVLNISSEEGVGSCFQVVFPKDRTIIE